MTCPTLALYIVLPFSLLQTVEDSFHVSFSTQILNPNLALLHFYLTHEDGWT